MPVSDRQYSWARKRFLKDAKRHYSKEAWDDKYLRGLAITGGCLGFGGTALAYAVDNPWALVPAFAGVMNMGQALYKKHVRVKAMTDALDERTKDFTLDQLVERIDNKDFDIPEPTEEQRHQGLMDLYALRTMYAVAEKDFGILRYPWQVAGAGIAAVGFYKGVQGDSVASGLTLSAGSFVFLIGTLVKQRKIAKVAKKVSTYLQEKGFSFFDNYIRDKDPYDFYHHRILGESLANG